LPRRASPGPRRSSPLLLRRRLEEKEREREARAAKELLPTPWPLKLPLRPTLIPPTRESPSPRRSSWPTLPPAAPRERRPFGGRRWLFLELVVVVVVLLLLLLFLPPPVLLLPPPVLLPLSSPSQRDREAPASPVPWPRPQTRRCSSSSSSGRQGRERDLLLSSPLRRG